MDAYPGSPHRCGTNHIHGVDLNGRNSPLMI
jgi:hypothetical protein